MGILLPLVAHVYPDAASNHFALRKYTGNHPYHSFIVRRIALPKLNRVLGARQLCSDAAPLASPGQVQTGSDAVDGRKPSDFQQLTSLATLVRGRLNAKAVPYLLESRALPKGSQWADYTLLSSA